MTETYSPPAPPEDWGDKKSYLKVGDYDQANPMRIQFGDWGDVVDGEYQGKPNKQAHFWVQVHGDDRSNYKNDGMVKLYMNMTGYYGLRDFVRNQGALDQHLGTIYLAYRLPRSEDKATSYAWRFKPDGTAQPFRPPAEAPSSGSQAFGGRAAGEEDLDSIPF